MPGCLTPAREITGYEIGGGSIRIRKQLMHLQVFDVIGLSPEEAGSQFGFLLDAFKYGAIQAPARCLRDPLREAPTRPQAPTRQQAPPVTGPRIP